VHRIDSTRFQIVKVGDLLRAVASAAWVPSPQIIATPTSGPILSNGGAITITGSVTGGPGGDGAWLPDMRDHYASSWRKPRL
jgi:hypothetical protein